MERPHARIPPVELKNRVSARLHDLRVSPLRVVRVRDSGSVPCSGSFGEDEELLAVQVHGVREGHGVVKNEPDCAVGAEVVGSILGGGGWGRGVGGAREEREERGVEVGVVGGVVHGVDCRAGGVEAYSARDGEDGVGCAGRGDRVGGCRCVQGVVGAGFETRNVE